jgi:hypothetical protein
MSNIAKIKENITKIEENMVQIEEVIHNLNEIKRNVGYGSHTEVILSSYVIPYLEGVLGGGQIMMSLKDVLGKLNDELEDECDD